MKSPQGYAGKERSRLVVERECTYEGGRRRDVIDMEEGAHLESRRGMVQGFVRAGSLLRCFKLSATHHLRSSHVEARARGS